MSLVRQRQEMICFWAFAILQPATTSFAEQDIAKCRRQTPLKISTTQTNQVQSVEIKLETLIKRLTTIVTAPR